jgi:FixJ family two-component response regulator
VSDGQLTEKDLATMMNRYLEGESPKKIAADYGIHERTFHRLRAAMGVGPRRKQGRRKAASVVTIAEARKMLERKRNK